MNETTETTLVAQPIRPPSIAQTNNTLIDLLRVAVDRGADVATLERLAKLYEAAELDIRKKEFYSALADAKAAMPAIVRDKEVPFKDSTKAMYKYETFAAVAAAVEPVLAEHGLFYTFPDPEHAAAREPNRIYVTCRLAHRNGYYIESTKDGAPDVGQNRNAVQAQGSTTTYLQRYTLKSVLGLAVSQDSDAAGKGNKQRFADRPENLARPASEPTMSLSSDKPVRIPFSEGMLWEDWTKSLLVMITGAQTHELVEAWTKVNNEPLTALLKEIPDHYNFVLREVTKRLRALRVK